jgi:tRNA(Ile)-lysidine synthase
MFVADVRACIDEGRMLPYGAHVIVAVSGGADSVALLAVLFQLRSYYGMTLTVVHVNHQLRGKESRRDALFVEQYTARLGVPCYVASVDVKSVQGTTGLSSQHAARKLRYESFMQMRCRLSATRVALGHTANDQAETLLVRLVRGSGPAGFAGIPSVRLPYIRPLIRMYRHEVEAYLTAHGLPWVEDSTNTERRYLRNRLRLDLVPMLRQYNPQIDKRLNDLATMLSADNRYLEWQTDILVPQVVAWHTEGRLFLECRAFCAAALSLQRRVLRRISDTMLQLEIAVSFRHIEVLRHLLTEAEVGKRATFPGGWRAERQRIGVLVWNVHYFPARNRIRSFAIPGHLDIPELALRLTADILPRAPMCFTAASNIAHVDLERLALPLEVRYRQAGDRVYPLGAPGRKKLKDFFIDKKIPKAQRDMIPLVCSGTEIVWVVGYSVAEPYKVDLHTRQVVRLTCESGAKSIP